jgi:hypothetical protein
MFGRVYMRKREQVSKRERVIGGVILGLLVVIGVSVVVVARQPSDPLFQLLPGNEPRSRYSPEELHARTMMPELGTVGWTLASQVDVCEPPDYLPISEDVAAGEDTLPKAGAAGGGGTDAESTAAAAGLDGPRGDGSQSDAPQDETSTQALIPAEALVAYDAPWLYRGHYLDAEQPDHQVRVEIADAGSPARAFGLFGSLEQPANADLLPVGNDGWQSAEGGTFWAGRYVVRFTRVNLPPDSLPSVRVIADALASVHLSYGRPFWAEHWLPGEGQQADGLHYVHEAPLGLEPLEAVFLAEYTDGHTEFVLREDTLRRTRSRMDRLISFLDTNGEVVGRPTEGGSPFLAAWFGPEADRHLVAFVSNTALYGVVGGDASAVAGLAQERWDALRPALAGAAPAAAGESAEPESPFPPVVGLNWEPPEEVAVYTPTNLWQKINGRADLYLGFNMVRMTFGTYRSADDPSISMDVYWFDMGKSENALGVYQAEHGGQVDSVDVGTEGYVAGGTVLFRKAQHYIRVEAPDTAAVYLEAGPVIARALADSIEDDATDVWAERALPTEGRLAGSFEYQATDAFSLDFLSEVFSADYEFEGQRLTLFVHQTSGPAAAAEILKKYEAFFADYGQLVHHPSETDGILVGESGSIHDAVFAVGAYIAGVSNASQAEAALTKAREFREYLEGVDLPEPAGDGGGASDVEGTDDSAGTPDHAGDADEAEDGGEEDAPYGPDGYGFEGGS